MATPSALIPRLEGMVAHQIGSGDGGTTQGNQIVADWVTAVKYLLQHSTKRYLDDYQFNLLDDVDETGVPLTSATHLLAALAEMTTTIATDGDGWLSFADLDSQTFDGTVALDNATVAIISISDVVTTGVSEFYPAIWFGGQSDDGTYDQSGINLATGLTVAADGVNGGAFAANALRVWVLTRD